MLPPTALLHSRFGCSRREVDKPQMEANDVESVNHGLLILGLVGESTRVETGLAAIHRPSLVFLKGGLFLARFANSSM